MQDTKIAKLLVMPTLGCVTGAFIAVACSTAAEPAEDDGPPVCDCPAGERKLQCHTGSFDVVTQQLIQVTGILEKTIFCFDEAATEQEKEDACLDACDEWLDGAPRRYCDFYEDPPYFFLGCIAPEDDTGGTGGGDSAGFSCPQWYDPSAAVSGYTERSNEAWVLVEKAFVLDIRDDMRVLYVCDETRYEEVTAGSEWQFVNVAQSDFFFEIGIRSGDRNAQVRGFNPAAGPTTSWFTLVSLQSMYDAYTALLQEGTIQISVNRGGNPFYIYLTLDQ